MHAFSSRATGLTDGSSAIYGSNLLATDVNSLELDWKHTLRATPRSRRYIGRGNAAHWMCTSRGR
jgi:hypothetical protein